MIRTFVLVLILSMATAAFGSQIEKEQQQIRKTQSRLSSASGPLQLRLAGGEEIVGTASNFQESTFLFLESFSQESREINYLSVAEIKAIKCLCEDSSDILRGLNGRRKEVDVELIDSSKWKGTVIEADHSSVLLLNSNTHETHRISFANVKKVDARSEDAKALKKVAIIGGVVVGAVVITVHFFIPYT